MTYYAVIKKGTTDWKTRTTAVFEDLNKAERYITKLHRDIGYNSFKIKVF